MINVNINIKNTNKLELNESELTTRALLILRKTDLSGIVDIDLTICGISSMRKLNFRYRGIDSPTDVLSFPIAKLSRGRKMKDSFPGSSEIPVQLGDIFICYPILIKQTKEQNNTIEAEFYHLFEHGIKHLVGFHHK